MSWWRSKRRLTETVSNAILFALVILSWTYLILAGRQLSQRYLAGLNLTRFKSDRRPIFSDDDEDNL